MNDQSPINNDLNIQQPQQFPNKTYTPPKPKTSIVIWIVIILGIFLVTGSLAVLGYTLLSNTPEKQLERMAKKIQNIKTVEYDGSVIFNVTSNQPAPQSKSENPLFNIDALYAAAQSGSFSANFKGKSDYTDKNNPKGVVALDMKSTGGNDEFEIALQAITQKQDVYINVIKAPSSDFMDLSRFTNRWIHLPGGASNALGMTGTSLPASELLEASVSAKYKQLSNQITTAYIKNRFLATYGNTENEKIGDIETQHIKLKFDSKKFEAFALEVYPLLLETPITPEVRKNISEVAILIKDIKVDIWIGKDDDLPYKIKYNQVISDTAKSTFGDISAEVNLKNFDLPFKIEAPADAVTLEELVKEMYSLSDEAFFSDGPSESMAAQSRDIKRLTDLTNLKKAIDVKIVLENKTSVLPVCKGNKTVTRCTSNTNLTEKQLSKADGTGWIPLDLSDSIAVLPVDPENGKTITNSAGKEVTAGYYFRSDGDTYKLATYLESPDLGYRPDQDGGTDAEMYEVGSNLTASRGF
jgi:hypothetical protein